MPLLRSLRGPEEGRLRYPAPAESGMLPMWRTPLGEESRTRTNDEGNVMIEYELIQQRQHELQELARVDRLVRESANAGRHAGRPAGRLGVLRRLGRALHRPAHATRPHAPRLG